MALDPARELGATITGDGRTTLTLVGEWPAAVTVTSGAVSEVVRPSGAALTVTRDFVGRSRVVFTPAAR
jgi:hypothetical protein